MTLLYGDAFTATRFDLALLALGIGGFLAACTFCQALLARAQGGAAALRWTAAAITFVALELTLGGTPFHRVAVAFAVASALMAATLAPPSAARRSPSLAAAVRAAAHSDAVVFGGVLVWTAVLAALSWG